MRRRKVNWDGPRPPWWPEGEPWPPERPHWEQMRRGFFWRAMAAIGLFVFVSIIGCVVLGWIGSILFVLFDPPNHAPGPPPFLFWRAGWVLVPIIVVSGVVAFITIRRVSSPMGVWLEAAGRVEAGDYTVRVPSRGPRELRQLASAFNAMTARLQQTEEQRRQLLADVTHELRTPLTVIQGEIEGMIDGVYPPDTARLATLLDETHVMARLIDDLRTLSLAESGSLKLYREPTDLQVLLGEAVAGFRGQTTVDLRVEVADTLPILDIDPVRMREVITNLVANALRYTPPDGRVLVRAACGPTGVELSVQDTGQGIAPDVLPHIFERFYRSPDSPGSGLGLAIAKNLVEAHGGTILAESTPGNGTCIRIHLPGG